METFTAPDKMSADMRRNGVTICAFFGLGWFIGGAGVLGAGAPYWIGLALAVAISVGLVVAVPRIATERGRPRELPKDWGRRYGIWIAFEVVLIVAAIAVFNALDLTDFLPGTIAVIVGAHFLPLAPAFDEPKYRWTGYAMIVAGLAGIGAGLADAVVGGAVAGFGSAVALWATGAAVLKRG
ncbi:hypothetical protein [Glycomyces algeriensis]|uniref:Uncharacterized protein n=1 Tax=Glycomyces algeriensis TaxID=256037 RepID=A0A9W6GBS6_9ACTN|nr:hypothetical protein [Glycomyces algeriensis]MDA1365508.1 hypothetical protein [Glycomyces algeriensis]MDR7351194.1 hypothetical protein [Glycomyces algeriensis]GLI43907.1 hypothetical protein GALLR39Z86_37570 [Glycomyces algeriensis]